MPAIRCRVANTYIVLVFGLMILSAACGAAPVSPTPAAPSSQTLTASEVCAELRPGARVRAVCMDTSVLGGSSDTLCEEHGGVSVWLLCPPSSAGALPQVTASSAVGDPAAIKPTRTRVVADAPAATATITATKADLIVRAYAPVTRLYTMIELMDGVTYHQQLGKVADVRYVGVVSALGIFMSETERLLSQPPPAVEFQPVWDTGKSAAAMLKEVVRGWVDKTIQPKDVHAALGPAQDQFNQMATVAKQILTTKYGAKPEDLGMLSYQMGVALRETVDKETPDNTSITPAP